MTSKGQTVTALRRKVLRAAQAACANYQRGEITREAFNKVIAELEATKPAHKR